MKVVGKNPPYLAAQERSPMPGLVLMALVFLTATLLFALNSEINQTFTYLYLVPWLIGLAVVMLAPVLYLYLKGRFAVYDPLVLAVGFAFFPSFVIGGLMIVTGWSRPAFMVFIQQPEYYLPYTILIIALGFVGLTLGYLSGVGSYLGKRINLVLPRWDLQPDQYIIPGIGLLGCGVFFVGAATILGLAGFQMKAERGVYDGLISATTIFFTEATFILMYVLFRRRSYDFVFFAVQALMLSLVLMRGSFSGSRGTFVSYAIIGVIAFFFADPRITQLRVVLTIGVVAVALLSGMILGTTFRQVKGSEQGISIDQYSGDVMSTFDQLGRTDLNESLSFGFEVLAERIDSLSSVGVVVSSYETLAPYEATYELDDNIVRDLSIFWIPRFLWKDKPSESTPRAYADLYFSHGGNSYVVTPIVDLLRNFGPVGVLIGMFILGVILRIMYRAFVDTNNPVIWQITFYVMLVGAVNYESFYVAILSSLLKIGVMSGIGLVFVYLTARLVGYSPFNVRP